MAKNRKLGKTTAQRKAMLRTQVTDLLVNEKITTTLARAKETQAIANSLEDKKIVRAKRDTNGNKVTELVKSKNGNEYLKVVKEEVTEKRQKDMPSRLNARRKIMNTVCKVKDADGRNIDIPAKLFGELAERYATAGKVGGYTRIIKVGPRKGDAAEMAILELLK